MTSAMLQGHMTATSWSWWMRSLWRESYQTLPKSTSRSIVLTDRFGQSACIIFTIALSPSRPGCCAHQAGRSFYLNYGHSPCGDSNRLWEIKSLLKHFSDILRKWWNNKDSIRKNILVRCGLTISLTPIYFISQHGTGRVLCSERWLDKSIEAPHFQGNFTSATLTITWTPLCIGYQQHDPYDRWFGERFRR